MIIQGSTIREHLVNLQPQIGRLEAFVLVSACIGKTKEYLIVHDDQHLSAEQEATLNTMLKRRLAGEPIAYILGHQEFFGRPFEVNQHTLIPRPDTELIVEKALELIANKPLHVLDLGTGSGCIAISIKCEAPTSNVWATDFSNEAIKVASKNATSLNAEITFRSGSWFDALKQDNVLFDVIVSNPPYIDKNDHHLAALTYEPITALTDGHDGMQDITNIITLAPHRLKPEGVILIEHGWDQGEKTRALFSSKLWSEVETFKDYGGNDRVTKARLKAL